MAVKRFLPLPSPSTITTGATAVVQIPVGPRYHMIQVSFDNKASTLAAAEFSEMRLKINGKVQRVFTYAELQALNIRNGAQFGIIEASGGIGVFNIYLAEPWRKSNVTQDLLAWGTGNVDSFQLEIDLTAGQQLDALRCLALVDNSIVNLDGRAVQQPIGDIVKWFRTIVPAPATTVDINFGSLNNRDNFQMITFADASSYIASYKVIVDNFVVREATKKENDAMLTAYGMTPIATALDIVFDADDIINNYLPMVGSNGQRVQDFRIQLTTTTALTSSSCIYQVLGPPE